MIIKVGSDLDGVLVPLFETALPFLNGRFNTNISLEQVTSHDVSPVFGVSQQVLYEVLCDFYKTDEFKKMKPYPDSVDFIEKLCDKFGPVPIITARPPQTKEATDSLVNDNFGKFISGIYYSFPYGATGEQIHRTKPDYCQELRITDFVEDCYENAVEIRRKMEHPRARVWLIPKHYNNYNKERRRMFGIIRGHTREEIFRKVISLG